VSGPFSLFRWRLPSRAWQFPDMKLPFLGDTFEYLRSPIEWSRTRYERFGPVSVLPMFAVRRMAVVLGPDAVAEVLLNRDGAFSSAEGWSKFVGPFFHRGLLLLDGDEHRYHRRIMQHAFLPARISAYLDRMTPAITRELAAWPSDGTFEVSPAIQKMIFNLTSEVLTGSGLGTAADEVHRMFEACLRASYSPLRIGVPRLPWSRGIAARRRLEEISGAWVAERRASDAPADNLLSIAVPRRLPGRLVATGPLFDRRTRCAAGGPATSFGVVGGGGRAGGPRRDGRLARGVRWPGPARRHLGPDLTVRIRLVAAPNLCLTDGHVRDGRYGPLGSGAYRIAVAPPSVRQGMPEGAGGRPAGAVGRLHQSHAVHPRPLGDRVHLRFEGRGCAGIAGTGESVEALVGECDQRFVIDAAQRRPCAATILSTARSSA